MLRSLRGNPADGFPDFSPAGSMVSGRQGRLVTQAIRRSTQEIGESKEGKRVLAPFGGSVSEFVSAALQQGLDKRCGVR